MRGMQNRVLSEIDQDAQSVAHSAPEDDQIDGFFLRNAQDLGFLVAGFDSCARAR
jgi:hypothetical protein